MHCTSTSRLLVDHYKILRRDEFDTSKYHIIISYTDNNTCACNVAIVYCGRIVLDTARHGMFHYFESNQTSRSIVSYVDA